MKLSALSSSTSLVLAITALAGLSLVAACSSTPTVPGADGGGGTTGGTTSGSTTGGGSSVPLVCPLFTSDLAAKLSASPISGAGVESSDKSGSYSNNKCVYDATDGSFVFVIVSNVPNSLDENTCRTSLQGTPVTGVGSRACWVKAAGSATEGTLYAQKGSFYVSLISRTSEDAAKTVATAILAKL